MRRGIAKKKPQIHKAIDGGHISVYSRNQRRNRIFELKREVFGQVRDATCPCFRVKMAVGTAIQPPILKRLDVLEYTS
jgi:hypothetical protein